MAYLKPPWFTVKVFNRIAMATGVSNSETLSVTKRGTGEPQHIPVVTVDVGGTGIWFPLAVSRSGSKTCAPIRPSH